jgi:hypothetical protein
MRQLKAHGFQVWLDEAELRVGVALTDALRAHIENSDVFLVVASEASSDSAWVLMELEHAEEHGKLVVPLFIEPVAERGRFRDRLGVEATSLPNFARSVRSLMRDLLLRADLELSTPDPDVLNMNLRALAREEPELEPLIIGCLDGDGLHQEHMDTVYKAAFHPLDYALNALLDLMPTEAIATHAAYGFTLVGAGTDALRRWIELSKDGGLPLVTAVSARLEATLLKPAIELLGSSDPPNNHALYQFISRNAEQLESDQRRSVLRLVTWPVRGPDRLGDVLGWVAIKHFPQAIELQQMWSRWILSGCFDGEPMTPTDLANYLASANEEQLSGWEPVKQALRNHVRYSVRSGDKQKVDKAVLHLCANADAGTPVVPALLREMEGVSATAEWNDWRARDQETADEMGWYVFAHVQEALKERDWIAALRDAERMSTFEKERRRVLAEGSRTQELDTGVGGLVDDRPIPDTASQRRPTKR